MLEKPEVQDGKIIDCLENKYGLNVEQITFLSLGGDLSTAVYRVVANGEAYFCKLRHGAFDETAVVLPRYLNEQG